MGYEFVSGKTSSSHQNLIGANEIETLTNLTWWMRNNLGHGSLDGNEQHDYVKTHRFLADRLRPGPRTKTAIATTGCHTASKLMVDLARSVNIPLLHVRALDAMATAEEGNLFSKTHGGLIYGWGSNKPLVLWHTDEIYADTCAQCYPVDAKTGALLPPEQAAKAFFEEFWVSPQALRKAGFEYRLARVMPGRGYGKQDRGDYEDRLDFGYTIGEWKKKGHSRLDFLYDACHDYALCGNQLMSMAASNIVAAQLESNFKEWKGDFADRDLPLLHSIKDYEARAAQGMKALGGTEGYKRAANEYEAGRGKDLLKGK